MTISSSGAAAAPAGASPLPALGPTTGGERLSLLDALRGFALAGVFLVNLGSFTLYSYLSPELGAALPTAEFDQWARIALAFFASGKFITLFSLLFGLGFAVQLMRAEERGADARSAYMRRLLVLLLIGLAHATLLCWGDVLRFYAVLGFGMLIFYGIGLGIGPRFGIPGRLAAFALIFRPDRLQPLVAGALPLRAGRVAVAIAHLRTAAADAAGAASHCDRGCAVTAAFYLPR